MLQLRPVQPTGKGMTSAPRRCAALLALALVALLGLTAPRAHANTPPFPLTESFSHTTADPAWNFGGTAGDPAQLTAATDGDGNGWLRLTSAVNNRSGYAFNDTAFPSTNGVLAEFSYATWGGNGADGLTFFLYDGSVPAGSFHTGPFGGSIGYTNCPDTSTPGLSGAYVGVSLDEFGNFGNAAFCHQNGGFNNVLNPKTVVVRGGTSDNYAFIGGAAAPNLVGDRTHARRVKVAVISGKVYVYITYPDGSIQEVVNGLAIPSAPSTLKLGFVAATGGQNNNHEIRDASVLMPVDLSTAITDTTQAGLRGGRRTWTATVENKGPNATDGVTVDATAVSGESNVDWTCVATGGATCPAASGTGLPTALAVPGSFPVGGKLTFQINADVQASADNAQMSIASDIADGEETGEFNPTDNSATDTTDLPPLADADPTIALANNGVASVTDDGTWRGGNISYTYQWQRCAPDGTACTDIINATNSTYTVGAGDDGKTLRVNVTGTNASDTATASSAVLTLPDTTIATTPASVTASSTAAFTLTTTGPAGTTFQCKLDGAPTWTTCSANPTINGLAEGAHTLLARAIRGGLPDATPASFAWTVDQHTAVTLTAPAAGTIATATPTVTGTAEPGATVVVTVDGVIAATGVAGSDGSYALPLTAPLADGNHTIKTTATDTAGNSADASTDVTVDTVSPGVPALTAAPSALASTSTATFDLRGEEGSTFRCKLDDGAWTTCTPPVTYNNLRDGTHTFSFVAVDAAGNESARVDRTWTVDTTAPARPPVIDGPAVKTTATSATFKVSAEPGATLQCSLDGKDFAPCVAPIVLSGLAPGTHTLRVRQVDAAGNAGQASDYTWTVGAAAGDTPPAKKLVARVATRATSSGDDRVAVGCAIDHPGLRTCTVRAYGVDAAGRRVLIGTGTVHVAADGKHVAAVDVHLTKAGKRALARAVGGLKVTLSLRATVAGRKQPLTAKGSTVIYPQRLAIVPSINPFVFDSTTMARPAARRALRTLAADLKHAKTVTCVGHTDATGDASYNKALGLRRAQAVCDALHALGVKAKLKAFSDGETQPRATNATAAGRALNRRVELRVTY